MSKPRKWWGTSLCVLTTLAGFALPSQAEPIATITGGADETGQSYTWTITNAHDSPIVHVEIPHYGGDNEVPPESWKCVLSYPQGIASREGRLIATAPNAAQGIAPGQSAEFHLGTIAKGSPTGTGQVLIRFADDQEVTVPAEVPIKQSLRERHVSLIGLGVIFGAFLLFRAFKHRRRASSPSDGDTG